MRADGPERRTTRSDWAVTRALDAGASGAKLTGAGVAASLLVICPMERQSAVRSAREPGTHAGLPVKLDPLGWRVGLNVLRDIWAEPLSPVHGKKTRGPKL